MPCAVCAPERLGRLFRAQLFNLRTPPLMGRNLAGCQKWPQHVSQKHLTEHFPGSRRAVLDVESGKIEKNLLFSTSRYRHIS